MEDLSRSAHLHPQQPGVCSSMTHLGHCAHLPLRSKHYTIVTSDHSLPYSSSSVVVASFYSSIRLPPELSQQPAPNSLSTTTLPSSPRPNYSPVARRRFLLPSMSKAIMRCARPSRGHGQAANSTGLRRIQSKGILTHSARSGPAPPTTHGAPPAQIWQRLPN